MCGLIGGMTRGGFGFTGSEQKVLNELLFMDTVRGPDSTGVCLVRSDYTVRVAKKATWAPNFVCSKAYQEIDAALFKEGKMFMGHNRKATVGEISSENAHPFIVNNELVLMHNGSLPTHKHLADTTVDSEAIAIYLHKNWDDAASPEEKAKVLSKIGGAWALIWYDLRTEKLNIVRNAQRPLSIYEDKGTYFWASDENMLTCVLKRHTYYGAVKSVPVHTLLTFSESGLQEVVLPATAFFPQVLAHGTKPITPSSKIYTPEGHVSKNLFKRVSKELVGKTLVFNVEDFINIKGATTFFGDKTELSFNHEIIGYAPNPAMNGEIEDNYGVARGVVLSSSHNKTTGYVTFHVKLLGAAKYANQIAACH